MIFVCISVKYNSKKTKYNLDNYKKCGRKTLGSVYQYEQNRMVLKNFKFLVKEQLLVFVFDKNQLVIYNNLYKCRSVRHMFYVINTYFI